MAGNVFSLFTSDDLEDLADAGLLASVGLSVESGYCLDCQALTSLTASGRCLACESNAGVSHAA